MKDLKRRLREFWSNIKTCCEYMIVDIKRKPSIFKIGLFSIYIVIAFLVLLESILQLTPLLFLNIAEEQTGMVDLALSPIFNTNYSNQYNHSTNLSLLNLTDIRGKLELVPNLAALSPRWNFPINVSISEDQKYKAIGIILDSEYERNNGIGASLKLKDLREGECWISESLISLMQFSGIGFF